MTLTVTSLSSCPRCGYSLQGLPATGSCPECGFGYDSQTVMLSGIPRGLSQKSRGRMALWIAILVFTWLSFSGCGCMFAAVAAGSWFAAVAVLTLGVAWIAGLVYLIRTRRRDGQGGVQQFIFASHGFANITGIHDAEESSQRLVTWDQVDTVSVDRLGDLFHRVRIGKGDGQHVRRATLDLNVRCDTQQAQDIRQAIQARLDQAHGH